MSKPKNRDLSDDTGERIMQLVENSRPNPDRPRLSAPIEGELEVVEQKAAALLAAREQSQFYFKKSHDELMGEIELLRKRLRAKYGNKNKDVKNGSGEK